MAEGETWPGEGCLLQRCRAVCVFTGEQLLTYTLRGCLDRGVAVVRGPAVALATVEWPFVEVEVAERRLDATPLKWHQVFIWSDIIR